MIQHLAKSKVFLEKSLEKVFDDKCTSSFGYSKLVLLSDIMNQSNGIYEKQNDSITLEIFIKIK